MTKDEALKLALEALEEAWYHVGTFQPTEKAIDLYDEARAAIKEALAQPEPWEKFCDSYCVWTDHHPDCKLAEQEPVAWRYALTVEGTEVAVRYDHANWNMEYEPFGRHGIDHGGKVTRKPVYTTPPQRKPLSDEEFRAILRSLSRQQGWDGDGWDLALKEAIEAAHGIKGLT